MITSQMEKAAELAMVLALPEYIGRIPTGRLGNLVDRLKLEAETLIESTPHLNSSQYLNLGKLIRQFESSAGWNKRNGLHMLTYVNFLLAMTDKRPWGKIKRILFDIFDYFERANLAPAPCLWAGTLAAEKWEEVIKCERQ